jgi:hypothetical protein
VVQKMALEFKSGCKLSRKVFPSAVARNWAVTVHQKDVLCMYLLVAGSKCLKCMVYSNMKVVINCVTTFETPCVSLTAVLCFNLLYALLHLKLC